MTDTKGNQFTQIAKSMEIERTSIDIAQKGDEFGLKVKKKKKIKSKIYKTK